MTARRRKSGMKKWKKLLLFSLCTVILLAGAGLIAVNYAVDKVIDSMAASLEQELEDQLAAELQTQESGAAASAEHSGDGGDGPNGLTVSEADAEPEKAASDGETPSSGAPAGGKGNGGDDDEEPASTARTGSKESLSGYSSDISLEKANSIKENITLGDKASVTSILAGNLSLADLKLFQAMASGGMSVEEKREARKLLLDKLTPEEYNTLSGIARKYGISKGKTYDQVREESGKP